MTFDQLRKKLGVKDSAYSLKNKLKRACGISHTKELDLPQWVATLEFIEENYDYPVAYTMLTRLKRII